ncbi:putative crack-3 bf [Operophtera brumata]|uniref:Putative crack-3 bf n=1 Tax=Operophtera brumata TaxID=104452 RepID=A0A0L7LN35_OPEBR|nr:putative crack-3 bf [Operophtera brumata]
MEIVLDELKCSHVETSVICLSEHFVIKGEEHYLKLNNFSLKAIYARHDKRRGGACILTRNDIECVELDTIKDLATKNHFEICGIEIKHLKTIIICFYRIPNSDINIFFEKLQITLERLLFKGCKLVIAGDFNIDIFVKNKISNVSDRSVLLQEPGWEPANGAGRGVAAAAAGAAHAEK